MSLLSSRVSELICFRRIISHAISGRQRHASYPKHRQRHDNEIRELALSLHPRRSALMCVGEAWDGQLMPGPCANRANRAVCHFSSPAIRISRRRLRNPPDRLASGTSHRVGRYSRLKVPLFTPSQHKTLPISPTRSIVVVTLTAYLHIGRTR